MNAGSSDSFVFRNPQPLTRLPLANDPASVGGKATPLSTHATTTDAVPPAGSISDSTGIPRLPSGEPILKFLEELLREKDVVDDQGNIDYSRVKEVTVEYLDKDGDYTVPGKNTSANIYLARKFPITDKEAFFFEMRWSIKVEGLNQPIQMENSLFTNILVPKKGDPDVHERAKMRARSVAFVTGNLIKSVMDPKDRNHTDTKQLKDNLRSSSRVNMNFGSETETNFFNKNYLNASILTLGNSSLVGKGGRLPLLSTRSSDDSIVTVSVGDDDNKQSLTIDFNKLVRIDHKAKKILTEAHIMQNTKVTTGPGVILDDMRKLESLKKEDILHLEEKMRELEISEKTLYEFAKDRADQYYTQFERLRSEFKPTKDNGKIDKLTEKLESGKEFTEEEWEEIELQVAHCDNAAERMENLHTDLDRDIAILQKFHTDLNRKLANYKMKRYEKALENNPDQVNVIKEKVRDLNEAFFRVAEQRKAAKEAAQRQAAQNPDDVEQVDFTEEVD